MRQRLQSRRMQRNDCKIAANELARTGTTAGAALSRLISAWMRIAIFETMNEAEGAQRLWFILDELDALGTIEGLKDALARLRKLGGRCVLGFQSIAQVRASYGHEEAAAAPRKAAARLDSPHGSSASARSSAPQVSRSRQPDEWLSSQTTSEHHVTEHAVMPSEIEQLPDVAGFLTLASLPSWRRVNITRP